MSMFPWHFSQQKRYNSVYNVYDNYSNYGAFNERHNQRQIYQQSFVEPSFCSYQSNYPESNVQYQNNNQFYTNPDTKNYNGAFDSSNLQMYHPQGMMHSVPNCLTASQSFETSYFAPPSPLDSSPPSSPFDFDLDLLPDEIVSPANLDFSLQTPLTSSLSNFQGSLDNESNTNLTETKFSKSPDCQVPNSPSSFSVDSGILSPTMFSPSSEELNDKPSGHGSYSNKSVSGAANSPGNKGEQQRHVPSFSPLSMSPSSPIYSPGSRQQRRLSSTDSGKTSTSTASLKSVGASNTLGGYDICIGQPTVSLQDSLNEFAQLQQKMHLEREGAQSEGNRFQMRISEDAGLPPFSTTTTQSSFTSNTQVSNILTNLTPYPHDMLTSTEGGGKVPSSLSLRAKLHATIQSESKAALTGRKTAISQNKSTPLLRQVLEDKSFEQYGVKPLDFLIEPNSLGDINKSLLEPQAISTPEPESFVKQDVAGISNNPVISLAMDQVKKDIMTTCEILSISPDPSSWSKSDIKKWMTWTQQQYNIPPFDFGLWASYTGTGFAQLTENDFKQRIPQGGDRMFAQLDLWRSAALASSAVPALSDNTNSLSGNNKKQGESHIYRGLNTSPISNSLEVTMARNISHANINSSVQTPPPLATLQSPQPYHSNSPSLLYKASNFDFGPVNGLGSNKESNTPLLSNPLPDISTLQSPILKNDKFDIFDVLNMLDSGSNLGMEGHSKHPLNIKKEHHSSGPPQYPSYSQPPSSSYAESLILSTTASSSSHGNQSFMSSIQPQAMRAPTQLVYSTGLTNTTGTNYVITPSIPSLQIINTSSATTLSSPQQQESTQIKQENLGLPTHPLSHILPPPYPGTKPLADQSLNSQSLHQLQTSYISHNSVEVAKHEDEDEDVEDEDMEDNTSTVAQPHNLTPAVTISPVNVTAPTPNITGRTTTNIHLWQFIKELLLHPELHSSSIHWVDRETGIFKIVDSVRVATLWGKRKNRPAMNYDKLSRSLRQYYKKGIMKKTERTQRLVYQFCHPYHL